MDKSEVRFCIDCKWCRVSVGDTYCVHPLPYKSDLAMLVSSKNEGRKCIYVRGGGKCGMKGRLWESKK